MFPLGTWLLLGGVTAVGVAFVVNLTRHPAEIPPDPLPPEYRPQLPRLWVGVSIVLCFGLFASPAFALVSKPVGALAMAAFAAALYLASRPLLRARRDQVAAISADVRSRAAWMERRELEGLVENLERRHGSVMRPLRRLIPLAKPPEVAPQPDLLENRL